MKKRTKWILIIIAVVVIAGIVAGRFLRPDQEPEYSTEKVFRGELKQTVSVTGIVKPERVLDLALEQNGIVQKVNVEVGREVRIGDPLLNLEASSQALQAEQAQANLNLAQSNLKMAQTWDLEAAETTYKQAYQAYLDTKKENTRSLAEAEISLEETKNYTQDYQNYFDEVNNEYEDGSLAKYTRDLARATLTQIQGAERKAREALESLGITTKQAENTAWYTQEQARQALERQKALAFNWEKSNLLHQTDASRIALELARNTLSKTSLTSPILGIVSKTYVEEGEAALAFQPVVQVVSLNFEIEAKVPESDISQVEKNQEVEVSFDALDDEVFQGRVISVEPTETLLEGVTYYQIKVGFQDPDNLVKSGMTADLNIKIYTKDNVLIAPQRAVKEKEGQKYVEVKEGEEIREVPVVTGLRGDGGRIEIIDGLKEEDEVITFVKKD